MPPIYDHSGLIQFPDDQVRFFGTLPVRFSRYEYTEAYGVVLAQEWWSKNVRPLDFYRGCLGPTYSLLQLIIPECDNEQLPALAHMTELFFLVHDKYKASTTEEESSQAKRAHIDSIVQAHVYSDAMLDNITDKRRLENILNVWTELDHHQLTPKWTVRLPSLVHADPVIFAEFNDNGVRLVTKFMKGALCLNMTEQQEKFCCGLAKPIFEAIAITHDVAVRGKVRSAWDEVDNGHEKNIVQMIMEEKGAEDPATIAGLIREQISLRVHKYKLSLDRMDDTYTPDMKIFLRSWLLAASGYEYWCTYGLRYNRHEKFSDWQQEMIKDGAQNFAKKHGDAVISPDTP